MKAFIGALSGQKIQLGKRIASSGEGTVWHTNQQGYLAKLYHCPDIERVKKLEVMVAHRPHDPMLSRNHISLAWPKELLKTSMGDCVGFLMPAIRQGVDLTSVYNPRLRKQKIPTFNWRYLHTTALNIAWIIQEIHAKGHVVGDIKPQNVLVNNQALVSIIDTDSFQIRDPQTQKIYHCTVGSEGFTPVELLGQELATVAQTEIHDRFRLGVIIYLLLFGDHPFKGKWVGAGEPPEPTELIRRGFWPYAPASLIRLGPYTIPLEIVHPQLKQCFLKCFNHGHSQPKLRPTAAEWCQALKAAIADLSACPRVHNHWYRPTYGKCYWCDRKRELGVDIFDTAVATSTKSAGTPSPQPSPKYRPGSFSQAQLAPIKASRATRRTKPRLSGRQQLLVGGVACLLTGAWAYLLFQFNQPSYLASSFSQPRSSPTRRFPLENIALTKTLTGHNSSVIFVAIGVDGQTLVSAGRNGTIKRWNLESGVLQQTRQQSPALKAVTFNPNRRILASRGEAQPINVSSLGSGKRLLRFSGQTAAVDTLAFDPDGQMLASGGEDNIVRVWSLGSGKLLHAFSGHIGPVNAVAFSPNGQTLASGGEDQSIKIWNLGSGELVHTFSRDSGPVNAVAFSPNGQTLASGNYDGTIIIWQLGAKKLQHTLLGNSSQVNTLTFSPDGQVLASGGEDNTIKLWNLKTGELFRILFGHSAWVNSVTFSTNGQILASGSQDSTIKIWRVR